MILSDYSVLTINAKPHPKESRLAFIDQKNSSPSITSVPSSHKSLNDYVHIHTSELQLVSEIRRENITLRRNLVYKTRFGWNGPLRASEMATETSNCRSVSVLKTVDGCFEEYSLLGILLCFDKIWSDFDFWRVRRTSWGGYWSDAREFWFGGIYGNFLFLSKKTKIINLLVLGESRSLSDVYFEWNSLTYLLPVTLSQKKHISWENLERMFNILQSGN